MDTDKAPYEVSVHFDGKNMLQWRYFFLGRFANKTLARRAIELFFGMFLCSHPEFSRENDQAVAYRDSDREISVTVSLVCRQSDDNTTGVLSEISNLLK
jgi:hypothetical protein